MGRPLIFEKPPGVRDYLPEDINRKQTAEQKIADCFAQWGYQQVATPALEYYDTIGDCSSINNHRLYKLLDSTGRTLVLRPDMTTPIARMVASMFREKPLPLRLCYNAAIYRMQGKNTGKDSEFFQSGVELIGSAQPYADAEVIALAAQAMRATGLQNFKIAVGNAAFLESLLGELVADSHIEQLKSILIRQDYVGWQDYVRLINDQDLKQKQSCTRTDLLSLPSLQGGRETIERARNLTTSTQGLEALRDLEQMWDILEDYQVAEHLHVDFSLLRGQDYYTGMIFEVYAPPVGFPICGGGRYDQLIADFGRPAPAVGFGIWIERLLDATPYEKQASDVYAFVFDENDRLELQLVVEKAIQWRKHNYNVEIIGTNDTDIQNCIETHRKNSRYVEVWSYAKWSMEGVPTCQKN